MVYKRAQYMKQYNGYRKVQEELETRSNFTLIINHLFKGRLDKNLLLKNEKRAFILEKRKTATSKIG
jgi:hypothetical protein